MTVLVLGPTGVVGDAIVREALRDGRVAAVLAVSRRPLRHQHPKLQTILHQDFSDFGALAPQLARALLYAAGGGGVPSPADNRAIIAAAAAYATDRSGKPAPPAV